MRESEIKGKIASLRGLIPTIKENIDKIISPYLEVKSHLKAIEEIEIGEVNKYDDMDINYELDYEIVLINAMYNCLCHNKDIIELRAEFRALICDLKATRNGKEEKEVEKIQYYINYLRDELPILTYDCYARDEDHLRVQLVNMVNILDEIELEVLKVE